MFGKLVMLYVQVILNSEVLDYSELNSYNIYYLFVLYILLEYID